MNAILLILNRKFVRYVISGCTATIVNLMVVLLARQISVYAIAVFIGALAGMATSYVLTKIFVFNATQKNFDHAEIMRFLLVHGLMCIQIWVVSVSFESWVLPAHWAGDVREVISSVIGMGSVVLTGFFLHQRVTYGANYREN